MGKMRKYNGQKVGRRKKFPCMRNARKKFVPSVTFSQPIPITLYRKSDLCIPRNETARPHSQFLHLCIFERFLISHDRSAYLAATKYVGTQILGIYKLLTDT
jgi:hypothetical protein